MVIREQVRRQHPGSPPKARGDDVLEQAVGRRNEGDIWSGVTTIRPPRAGGDPVYTILYF